MIGHKYNATVRKQSNAAVFHISKLVFDRGVAANLEEVVSVG